MAHFARINEENMVLEVLVTNNEMPNEGYDWLTETFGGIWIKTSYNTRGGVHYTDNEPSQDQSKSLRKNYAGIGFTYDANRDAFIPPKPNTENNWALNEETCLWELSQ